MFSKYDELSKLIRNYIEASLMKSPVDVTVLNKYLMEKYKVSLSNIDITNLVNKISSARKLRKEYEFQVQNNLKQEEEVILTLKNKEALVLEAEGSVREFGYTLASKICIMLYKGPLTIDTMKELKEHNYDGSYGSTTMMQMYALYHEQQRLEIENRKMKSSIAQKDVQLEAFNQQYKQQFFLLEQYKTKTNDLMDENKNMKMTQEQLEKALLNQGIILQSLSQTIENLNHKIVPIENENIEFAKAM